MEQNTIKEGKIVAIISYITIIGLIIAYLINSSKKNEFTKFHIGQSIRIVFLSIFIFIALGLVVKLTGLTILSYITYAPFIFAVLGVINVINGKAEPLPIIGSIGNKK